MIKRIILIITVLIWGINICIGSSDWSWWDETDEIYTQDKNDVIRDNDIDDPLKNGTRSAVQNVDWVIDADTSTSEQSQWNVIKYISKWINYFLALLWTVLIIFIIKDWIVIITAAWDDNKQKEAFKNVKNYIIALIWIWVAYLLVNLIFHFVNVNTI